MQNLLKPALCTLMVLAASPAFAGGNGFKSTIAEPLKAPVNVEVVLGDDLAYRANHLPKKLKDRRSNRLNDAFGNNGYYGEKELVKLAEKLEAKLEQNFEKQGIVISGDALLTLEVVLVDAKPNRPTFAQMQKQPSLSHQSISLGGALIESDLINADGNVIGSVSYKYYETDIQDAQYGGTWSDAHRAINRYAVKTSKVLSGPNS